MKPKTCFLSILLLMLLPVASAQGNLPKNDLNFYEEPEMFMEKLENISTVGSTEKRGEVYEIATELMNAYETLYADNLKLQGRLNRIIYSNRITEMELRDVVFKPETQKLESSWWPYFFWLNVLGLLGVYIIVLFKKKQKVVPVKLNKKNGNNVKVGDFRLTGREIDVLTLMCKFKSNPEISKILFISMNTTKTHVSNILGKLEVSNRKEAIHKVRRLNLLEKSNKTGLDKTVKEKSSVLSIITLGFVLMFCKSGMAQLNLENQTDCSFLVKLNLVEEGDCRPNGTGGLVVLESKDKIALPPLPQGSWIISYGVEEVNDNPVPIMVGKSTCGFNTEIKDFGSCKATLQFSDSGLIIQ